MALSRELPAARAFHRMRPYQAKPAFFALSRTA